MYAAGKAPLRAVVGTNSAESESELVCYRTLANSLPLALQPVICDSDNGGVSCAPSFIDPLTSAS